MLPDQTEKTVRRTRGNSSVPAAFLPLAGERRRLRLLLSSASLTLLILLVAGLLVERTTHSPLLQIGQRAPDFTLPSDRGGARSLAAERGHPVVLVFVPSVLCHFCQEQLRTLQTALPELRTRRIQVLVVSVDTSAVQRAEAGRLGLDYPLLSEAPTVDQHPVGSAYGVYNLAHEPLDTNALFVIDASGIVRAVHLKPDQMMTAPEIFAQVAAGLGPDGGSK